jgi:putative oxidoreductase
VTENGVQDWIPLPLRLVTGGFLAYHGFVKLSSRRGHENIVFMLKQMGMPASDLMGWAVGGFEFFGGLALVAGIRTRATAGVVVGEVVVNLLNALRHGGFPTPLPGGQPLPGVESSCFYGSCSTVLLMTGGGKLSVDQARSRNTIAP